MTQLSEQRKHNLVAQSNLYHQYLQQVLQAGGTLENGHRYSVMASMYLHIDNAKSFYDIQITYHYNEEVFVANKQVFYNELMSLPNNAAGVQHAQDLLTELTNDILARAPA